MKDKLVSDVDRAAAARILGDLLHFIEVGNANAAAYPRPGRFTFSVTHAWTEATAMYVVFVAPPSVRHWGLVRDTRSSLINMSGWDRADDPARYYYLLDLEEDWPGAAFPEPGENPGLIWWRGDVRDGLPQELSKLPEEHRYTPPPVDPAWIDHTPPPVVEPRRYADPNGPLPPGTRNPW
ncbi:hypothetical protein [Mycobacterium sp. PSTR-4-N]|uniref:hypothetical protein n=1 Tax=Mycobacterium sp. PSTR-4-N TaxID=2917745 RepID=UPI001F1507CC|nr:hypothetical protein [Mycobacterium sp. PSTR-4-N]MCG7597284.1 hypothetical protein [Mycobacterium sp. PSTR-4-N]